MSDANRMLRLKKARMNLLVDAPFFGTLAMRLENVLTEDPGIDTAATDGERVYWCRDFMDKLTDPELRGVVAHEVMHVTNGHAWRRVSRDHWEWNVACDFAINHVILASGLVLPAGGLFPTDAQKGKSAEALYKDPPPGKPQGGNKGDPGKCGSVLDSPRPKQERAKLQEEVKIATAQAAIVARSQGKLPADLERMVSEILNPRVPWETVLRDFITRSARNDFNFSVPNRRHLQRGFVLPTLISDELPEIMVCIDTSGSIDARELNAFAAEISGILGAYETSILLTYVDAKINGNVETLTRADLPLKLRPRGGGGTDFRPPFNWLGQQGKTPACLVYLTDGYGVFPSEAPEYPVLWVMTNDQVKAPFGDSLYLVV